MEYTCAICKKKLKRLERILVVSPRVVWSNAHGQLTFYWWGEHPYDANDQAIKEHRGLGEIYIHYDCLRSTRFSIINYLISKKI